ncbi:MAG: hypothetical protein NZZ41_07475 [Candidatus Dojkabacteria bacterium]|nr:hypothetical protein [Candidatus Dojkabacteria bacterium]
MDNDSAVFILRDSINKAKQTAVIDCVPYSEEQKDKEIANFVKKNIMELIQNGRQRMIDDITLYIRD